MIRERVMAGLSRAEAEATQLGRRRIEDTDAEKVAAIIAARTTGVGSAPSRVISEWMWAPCSASLMKLRQHPHRLACETHAPVFWDSEPPPRLAQTPLPKSNRTRLNTSIFVILNSSAGLCEKPSLLPCFDAQCPRRGSTRCHLKRGGCLLILAIDRTRGDRLPRNGGRSGFQRAATERRISQPR
jgi:hypothetical protein